MISYQLDGSIVLQGVNDPAKAHTIPAGTPRAEADTMIATFFAADLTVSAAVQASIAD